MLLALACSRRALPRNARALVCGAWTLTFNARHALACLSAAAHRAALLRVCLGARHALACGRCCGTGLLASGVRRGCAASFLVAGAAVLCALRMRRHACCGIASVGGRFDARHSGAFTWYYARYALARTCGRMLVPCRGAALRGAGRFGLAGVASRSRNAGMGDVVVASSCICGVSVGCAGMLLACRVALHAIAHERSRGVVLAIKFAFALQLVARAGHRGAGRGRAVVRLTAYGAMRWFV